ncbi:MAG: hypothetical protein CMN64_05460 [Sphingobium sp.]|nr:hypothetical protein [Sphingobium sp.]
MDWAVFWTGTSLFHEHFDAVRENICHTIQIFVAHRQPGIELEPQPQPARAFATWSSRQQPTGFGQPAMAAVFCLTLQPLPL